MTPAGPMTPSDPDSRALRAAAASHVLLGVGFGAGAVVTLVHLALTGELPMTRFGFRSMSGPFERLGRKGRGR